MRHAIRQLWPALLCVGIAAAQQSGSPPPAPNSGLAKAAEEFKQQTRALGLRADSPKQARARSSSNAQWHGRLYENLRNDFLDAIPHEIVQRGGNKSLLRRNQFGFNVAGPVAIPKLWGGLRNTWFSLSYEGVRERISRSSLLTVATAPERNGDFSQTVDSSGESLPIYDPSTTRPNPNYDPRQIVSTSNLQYARDPFPNNVIPQNRLDPVATKALNYYALPNANAGPFFRNNYFVVSPETNFADGTITKIDHQFNERHRAALNLNLSSGLAGAARLINTIADPGNNDRQYSSRSTSVDYTYTPSPKTINTFTFAASSDASDSSREGEKDAAAQIGLQGSAGGAFPVLRISPYLQMGRANPIVQSARNTFVFSDGFTTKIGKNNFRASASFVRYQVNVLIPQYPAGNLRFSSGLTSLPGIVNTGHGFASFMLGLSEYGEETLVSSPSYFRRSTGGFVLRDQYEVTRGLIVSIAMNWEMVTPRVEKYDRQATVDLTTINPVNNRPGALVAANRGGFGRAFQPFQTRVEPSASLTWNPGGSSKNVIRLGYGRSYSAIPIYTSQWGTQGFVGAPTWISSNSQLQPAIVMRNGLPPLAYPLPDIRPEAANDTVADLIEPSGRQPTYQSFSASYERSLASSLVLTAGSGYAHGRNLLVSNGAANPNAARLDSLVYRDQLNNETFNRAQRPYPQFRGFDVFSSWPLGRYKRYAAYLRTEKRSSKGLTLTSYFEISRQMDDYSGPYGTQDYYNRANEWSLTAGNSPAHLSLSYVYELPMGANKPLFAYSDWRRYLVDGWSISGMASINRGDPIFLRSMFNNTGGVVDFLRVNVVPGVNPGVSNPGPELWFNPAAFDQPPDFTIGNGPRTHPTLRNPGSQNHDVSFTKRFAVGTDRTVEFSAVGFNFLNHANWNDPDNVIGPESSPNVNAGKIIGSRGGRVVQLGLRFSF